MSKSMSVEGQMQDLLKGIDNEVKEVYKKSAEAVARDTVQELRNTSPKKTGDYARQGEVVAWLHTNEAHRLPGAEALLQGALSWGAQAPEQAPLIYEIIR